MKSYILIFNNARSGYEAKGLASAKGRIADNYFVRQSLFLSRSSASTEGNKELFPFKEALMKALKSGCGSVGLDLNSG